MSSEYLIPITLAKGGKAGGLARLIAAGLPVPGGFVITWSPDYCRLLAPHLETAGTPEPRPTGPPSPEQMQALAAATTHLTRLSVPAGLAETAQAAAAKLGTSLAVRSSASVEDCVGGAAPGLFATELAVEPTQLLDAAVAVWRSALCPAVWTYLAIRRLGYAAVHVEVIVQPMIAPARLRGTAYTRPEMLIEPLEITEDDRCAVAELASRAEAAIGAEPTGADVEWVADTDRHWLVQARPIAAPLVPANRADPTLFAFSTASPSITWRWDVAHNPEPLSQAQIGLVERVGADHMRVVGGYLYFASRPRPPHAQPDEAPRGLVARFHEQLGPAMQAALDRLPTEPSLAEALEAYDQVYEIYAHQLGPALAAARRELPELVAEHYPGSDAVAVAAKLIGATMQPNERAAAAAMLAPAWDVACAPPEQLAVPPRAGHYQVASGHSRIPPSRHSATAGLTLNKLPPAAIARARELARIAELDDLYFAGAQAAVRCALLALARRWSLDPADIFALPLAELLTRSLAEDPPEPGQVRQRATATRADLSAQRRTAMPLSVRAGKAVYLPAQTDDDVWHGRGCGGRAGGVAFRITALSQWSQHPAPLGSVLITTTVTPAMTPLLRRVAAIVIEHGGLLDHGAAMARELDLPCVVGVPGIVAQLHDGDSVWVDGIAGVVLRTSQ